jgi:hypothetical protein
LTDNAVIKVKGNAVEASNSEEECFLLLFI